MRLLPRYVLFELLRVFLLALSGLTVLLTFAGFVGEAVRSGFGPKLILQIMPFVVPSLLPFTIPATLLLTVTIVYGRMSGDQEITAIKAAGINVMSVILPSIMMGLVLSAGTFFLTDQFIPWAKGNIKKIVASGMEEIFLDVLRTQHSITQKKQGIQISVSGVDGRRLLEPRIRYSPGSGNAIFIEAEEATIGFDIENEKLLVRLINGQLNTRGTTTTYFVEEKQALPLPSEITELRPRDIPISKIRQELAGTVAERDAAEHRRIINTAFALTHGDFESLHAGAFESGAWPDVYAKRRAGKLKTEIHSRYALACSCFFFVLLGGPFSIYYGRSQFLTNFFLCFVPVLMVYYPVVMLMMNLSKGDSVNPVWAMWVGNLILLLAGGYMLHKVRQH